MRSPECWPPCSYHGLVMAKARLHVVWIGRHLREPWESMCADYRRRIDRMFKVADRQLRLKDVGEARKQLQVERKSVEEAVSGSQWTVALDRRGRTLSSVEFSRVLGKKLDEGAAPIHFVIGSDLGLHPEWVKGAHLRLSMGAMTLPHELARLVLYEQIYRALTIRAGMRYHREPLSLR